MKLTFHVLTRKDIPAIKKIANYMPYYFQNIIEFAEILMDDSDCYYYGAFSNDILVGVGNLRRKSTKLAWIESIRVAPINQLKGIGLALFSHGMKKAIEEKFPTVAFATDASNYGSNRIGKKLGFQLVTEMIPLWLKISDFKFDSRIDSKFEPIAIDKVIKILNSLSDGPKDEICIGWSFIPIEKGYFDKHQPNLNFYAIEDTILLESIDRNLVTNEIQDVRAIIYGSINHVKEILIDFIARNDTLEHIGCVIGEDLVSIPLELGFQYLNNDEGKPIKILLWRKSLAEKK